MKKNKEKNIILDLCGGTGSWSKPWKENGYDVHVITLPEYDVERWNEYPALVEILHSNTVYGILAAPPCTQFSIARNDATARERRNLRSGMRTVNACLEIVHECLYDPFKVSENSLKFWALENPRGYLDRFLGKPSFEFDPCDFGDPYTKRTYLWGMFNEPRKSPVIPFRAFEDDGTFVKNVEHFRQFKSVDPDYKKKTGLSWRTIARSITPEGFANAFYEANKIDAEPMSDDFQLQIPLSVDEIMKSIPRGG